MSTTDGLYRQFFRNNRAVSLLIDPQSGAIVEANPAAELFYGYSSGILPGLNITAINILDPEQVRREMTAAVAEERNFFRFRHRLASGDIRDVEVYSTPLMIDGRILLHSIIHDTTPRRRAEQELRHSHDILAAIAHLQSRFIAEDDPQHLFAGLLTDILALTQSRHGFIAEALRDADGAAFMKVHALLSGGGEDHDLRHASFEYHDLDNLFGAILTSAKAVISNDPDHDARCGVLPSGHPHLDSFLGVPLLAGTELVGVVALANRDGGYDAKLAERMQPMFSACATVMEAYRNVMRRRAAETALEQRALALERSNAELEQFAYVASHDLQEPLRMVISYTQLLNRRYRGQMDQDADAFIGYAVEGALRMQQLINDLLAYSRVDDESQSRRAVDLEQVLARVEANLHGVIEESGVTLSHSPLPIIAADPLQMELLLQNLVGNAIKYRRPGVPPLVYIGASQEGDALHLTVSDNGIGIETQYLERIFVLFQRLHTREHYPGTGIGLALCKKIAEHHGGRIWVESVLGIGSRFHVLLPRNPAQ